MAASVNAVDNRKEAMKMSTNQVSLYSAMRSNLYSLQNTSKQISQTQDRLSTGKKVNTAMDNPTNYFAALSLNTKSNVLSVQGDSVSISQEAIQAHKARADMSQNLVNTYTSGAHILCLADTNEEASHMLALQTQQTLGIKSLSLSSQSAQSVLQLF